MANYDNDNNVVNYESSDGNVKFTYRKINELEIEIVEWISVTSHIEIPSHIDSNLKVVSLGENSFRNLLDIERVVVPLSVERICPKAFTPHTRCKDHITVRCILCRMVRNIKSTVRYFYHLIFVLIIFPLCYVERR